MLGLLADVNVEGHLAYVRKRIVKNGLLEVLLELQLRLVTFDDLRIPKNCDDRTLWKFCQETGWVLFTENRNHDGPNSLQATLLDSWTSGNLPVLTLGNKATLQQNPEYANRVANDIVDILFGVHHGEYRESPRIFVPLTWPPAAVFSE